MQNREFIAWSLSIDLVYVIIHTMINEAKFGAVEDDILGSSDGGESDINKKGTIDKVHEAVEIPKTESEIVMGKVEDINRNGIAYSSVDFDWHEAKTESGLESLKLIFREGLRGMTTLPHLDIFYKNLKESTKNKEEWVKLIKAKHPLGVFFNIVGKASDIKKGEDGLFHRRNKETGDWDDFEPQPTEIGSSPYVSKDSITILFDTSSLNESQTNSNDLENRGDMETRTFYSSSLHDDTEPDSEYGFVASYRIPPRLFTGIVVKGEYENRVNEIIETMKMVYGENFERLLPIYDVKGNLIYPQKIDHGDISKSF